MLGTVKGTVGRAVEGVEPSETVNTQHTARLSAFLNPGFVLKTRQTLNFRDPISLIFKFLC